MSASSNFTERMTYRYMVHMQTMQPSTETHRKLTQKSERSRVISLKIFTAITTKKAIL